jgi:hypothetical protein
LSFYSVKYLLIPKPATPPGRAGAVPIEVRDQLKILAIEQRRPIIRLIAEAFNGLFAKYGKPEIAPTDGGDAQPRRSAESLTPPEK